MLNPALNIQHSFTTYASGQIEIVLFDVSSQSEYGGDYFIIFKCRPRIDIYNLSLVRAILVMAPRGLPKDRKPARPQPFRG
jgi:hypothetical protein